MGRKWSRMHSHEAGYDAHLMKPVDLWKVQEVLDTMMNGETSG
jgi:hypothetical protein